MINVVILRNLRWAKKVEEALTRLSFSDWLSILRSFLGLFLHDLLSQILPGSPLDLGSENPDRFR